MPARVEGFGHTFNLQTEVALPTPTFNAMINQMRTMITDKQVEVKSLFTAASRISPIAQKATDMNQAYDAAFAADSAPSKRVTSADTLQGFAVILFFVSYFSLVIILSVFYYIKTGSISNPFIGLVTGIVFAGIIAAVMRQYG